MREEGENEGEKRGGNLRYSVQTIVWYVVKTLVKKK